MKKKIDVMVLIAGVLLLAVQGVEASLYYKGDVVVKEENILAEVTYENGKALVMVTAEYLIKNSGNEQEVEYELYAFGQKVEGEKIIIGKGGEKAIKISKTTILEEPYALTLDFNLQLQGKFIGNKAEGGSFTVKFPSKPTLTGINPEPTERTDLELRWTKKDYLPVTIFRVSWIKEEINIELKKFIIPSTIKESERFTIMAVIRNKDKEKYRCKIIDGYMMDSFEPVEKEEFKEAIPESPIEPSFWIYEREFGLEAEEEKVFTYKLRLIDSLDVNEMNLEGFRFFIPEKNFFTFSERAGLEIVTGNESVTTTILATSTSITTSTSTTTTTIPLTTTTTPKSERKEDWGYLLWLCLILIIVVGVVFLGYKGMIGGDKAKKRKNEEELMNWLKRKLKEGEDPEVLKKGLEGEGYNPGLVDEAEKKLW